MRTIIGGLKEEFGMDALRDTTRVFLCPFCSLAIYYDDEFYWLYFPE